jgi:asparagine synthase (glutamine-hydrolysing)
MCGIAGIVKYKRNSSFDIRNSIKKMVLSLRRRGPDDQSYWFSNDDQIALGFSRLSIQDLSQKGRQPMTSFSGRYVIVFNGEIYNFLELKNFLLESGKVQFLGGSDTEVLIACVEEFGILKTLEKIEGMFAFSILDIKEQKLYLIRDRFGEKPLYYGVSDDKLLFASDLDSIKKSGDTKLHVCKKSVSLYKKYGNVPAPFSIYQDIYKLQPGHYLKIDLRNKKEKYLPSETVEYWSVIENIVKKKKIINIRKTEAEDQVKNLLIKSIALRSISDVPIGAFLSGGYDSSTIVALSKNHTKLNTFSVGFNEAEFNEADKAKKIANYFNTTHHELFFTQKDYLHSLEKISAIYSEPFSDSSQIPTYLISKFASSKVKVCLSGDGGDEIFGGYNRHQYIGILEKINYILPKQLKRNIPKFLSNNDFLNSFFDIIKKVVGDNFKYNNINDKIEKLGLVISSSSIENVYNKLISNNPIGDYSSDENDILISANLNKCEQYKLTSNEKLVILDICHYLHNDLLCKVDRASMYNSLEVRSPYLDSNLLKFVWSLPLNIRFNLFDNKKILKDINHRILPKSLMKGPKKGFELPINKMLKTSFKEWVSDSIYSKNNVAMEYFQKENIAQKAKEHFLSKKDHSRTLWNFCIFNQWLTNEKKN